MKKQGIVKDLKFIHTINHAGHKWNSLGEKKGRGCVPVLDREDILSKFMELLLTCK